MVSTVSERPNHYERLGIEPSATTDEIARAFAQALHKPGPFGVLAYVGLAFETLRDPVRRKAYDRSIGLAPEPAPSERPFVARSLSGTVTFRREGAAAPAAERPPVAEPESAARRAPVARPVPAAKPTPRPAARPFAAAPRRDPIDRQAFARASAERPVPRPRPIEPLFASAESGTIDWKRSGTIAGSLVAAVALIGAWAGWEASNDTPQAPQQAIRRALPPSQPEAIMAFQEKARPEIEPASPAEPTAREAVAARRTVTRPRVRPIELTPAEEQELAGNAFVESVTEQAQTVEAPDLTRDAPVLQAASASMPLPDRVIARTIRRIGYPCGAVASKAQGAAPGVFTVTCTSGHSYRAQPVRGRYRFKRLG